MALSKDLDVIKLQDISKEYVKIGLMDFSFDYISEESLDINQEMQYKYTFERLMKQLQPDDPMEQIWTRNDWIKDEIDKGRRHIIVKVEQK